MEDAQAALGLNACAAAIVDRSKYASCQLVSSGGAGDNVLPDPIEVSDIFVVDGRERTGVFFLGVEALCPAIYSVYNCVIDTSRSMSTAGTLSLRSERPIAARPPSGTSWGV